MTHTSRIDKWIVLFIGAGMLLCLAGGILTLVKARSVMDLVLGSLAILIIPAVIGAFYPLRYEVGPEQLLVRAGPFRWRIPLSRIEEMWFTSNPLSAPAWSLKRIHIRFTRENGKRGFILISPMDRAAFAQDIMTHQPGIVQRGDRYVRREPPAGED